MPRVQFAETDELDFASLPSLETLTHLTLQRLPANLRSVARLADALPCLEKVALGSEQQPRTDASVLLPSVEQLTLDFPRVPDWIAVPPQLSWLNLHAPEATDADVRRCLAACTERLDSLGLRGTPVTDALFDALERFPQLGYLDAVDTRMSKEALERFAARRPGFKWFPHQRRQ